MCEYQLYQSFHLYIDSKTIRDSPGIPIFINNLYYTNYTISVMNDNTTDTFGLHTYSLLEYKQTVQETILSHANNMPPNTIAVYINPSITEFNDSFLFELNKWFLYKKCRATHIGSIWTCKMGILSEIVNQHGLELVTRIDLLPSIVDVCGDNYVQTFEHPHLITIKNDSPSVTCEKFVCKPLPETVHVLLATYERTANIRDVITQFQSQTCKHIHLHLLDNNVDTEIQSELDTILDEIRGDMCLTVHRLGWNSHCFGRITCIRKIMEEYMMEYVVIFDDDQIYETNWIENMLRDRKPLSTLSWYGKLFNKCDYWSTTISYMGLQNKSYPNVKEFTYFGPGGCMLDTNLFLFNELYNYKKYSEDIIAIDDIWMSFIFKKYLNIPFYRNRTHPLKCIDRNDHTKMTWANIKDKKKDLMTYLSTTYEWDVTKPTPKTFTVNGVFEHVYVLYTSTDNKSIEKLNQMNICATYIPIETDVQTTTKKIFESALKMNIKTALVLYDDVVFDDFFHYKFNKYICNIPEKWDQLNLDCVVHSKMSPTIGYSSQSMIDFISETK